VGKNKGVQLAVAFLLSFGLSVPAAFAAETIRIGGTGSALGPMRVLEEAFRKQYPNMEVVVVPGLGSGGGSFKESHRQPDDSGYPRHTQWKENDVARRSAAAVDPAPLDGFRHGNAVEHRS